MAGMPQLTIEVGGVDRAAVYESGMGFTVFFAYEAAEGEVDTDGVSIGANSLTLADGRIRDFAFNDAVLDHVGLAADAGHKVEAIKPELEEPGGAVVDGATLTLTYDEPLDEESVPPESAFTVSGGNGARRVSEVAVSGRRVELTLNPEVVSGEAGIQVSYAVPTATVGDPIRDAVGNEALGLSNVPVTKHHQTEGAQNRDQLRSRGLTRTYAIEDKIRVTITFSVAVEVAGTPRLSLELRGGRRTAYYLSGSESAALVFEYEVVEGESDTDGGRRRGEQLVGWNDCGPLGQPRGARPRWAGGRSGTQGGRGQAGTGPRPGGRW